MSLSIKNFMRTVWHNQKLELLIIACGIVSGIAMALNVSWGISFCAGIVPVFDGSRLSLIINAAAIILGIYIAVISIVATSVLGITRDMLAKGRDRQLLQMTFSGMMVNTVLVFFCVLFDVEAIWQCLLLIVLLAVAAVSFVKFMYLVFLIFQANFNQMSKQITEEELEREELITLLKKIERKLSSQ